MRKRFFSVFVAAICLTSLSGCLYTRVKLPLDTDVDSTTLGAKQGEATVQSVAWLVGWGDGGVEAAARNGGIKVINHMDVETFVVLFGAYSSSTTIVYGD